MSRALSRSGVFLLLSRFLLGGLFICLHKERNEVSKMTKGGRYGVSLPPILEASKSHDSQASNCSSLGSSKSCLATPSLLPIALASEARSLAWLRHLCFEVYRKIVHSSKVRGASFSGGEGTGLLPAISCKFCKPHGVVKQHNRFGPEPIRLTQVMYRRMAHEAQKALLATFVCTKVYITVENDGS